MTNLLRTSFDKSYLSCLGPKPGRSLLENDEYWFFLPMFFFVDLYARACFLSRWCGERLQFIVTDGSVGSLGVLFVWFGVFE